MWCKVVYGKLTHIQLPVFKIGTTMGRNTAWGNKAYKEVRSSGGSKDEARQASQEATEKYYAKVRSDQSRIAGHYEDDKHDFDSSFNGEGTNWHTAEDL